MLSVAGWRTVFWCLVGFGLFMTAMAAVFVPDSLAPGKRQGGGLRRFVGGIGELVRHRRYLGYMLTSVFSGFAMFAYISSSSFVLQEIKGLSPMSFSVFFAFTAGSQMLLSILNANLVTRVRPRRLIATGLTLSGIGVAVVSVSVLALNVALGPLCIGFVLVMAAQAFVFSNASALALGAVRYMAGVASALLGLAQAIANATSAPLASSGGGETAVPMVAVMLVGIVGAWGAFLLVGRTEEPRRIPEV